MPSVFRIQDRRTVHLQQRGHATRQNSKDPQHPRAERATSTPRRAGREGIPHSPRCLHLPSPGTPDRAGRRQLADPLPIDRVGTGKGRHFARRDRGAPPRTRHADRLGTDPGLGASPRCRLHGHGTRSFLRRTGPTRGGRRNVASRLVRNFRAVVADPDRPHASGATYFWRYVTERQLCELFERIIGAVLTNPPGPIGLELSAARRGGPGQTRGTIPADRLSRPPGVR